MTLREQWRQFVRDAPGTRFEQRYRRRSTHRRWWQSALLLLGAFLLMAAGLLMIVLPGPGLLTLLAGAALLAEESLFAARAMDRAELWVRKLLPRSRAK
ncbi:MAG TPA: PGPGW domain-containing protein [Rudaea sp.]